MAISLKQGLVYLAIAFVIVSIWNNPDNSSESMGAFLGDVGHFFNTFVDKSAQFIGGLTNGN
jgi:hypothetical protein